jgi:hypothetical protein
MTDVTKGDVVVRGMKREGNMVFYIVFVSFVTLWSLALKHTALRSKVDLHFPSNYVRYNSRLTDFLSQPYSDFCSPIQDPYTPLSSCLQQVPPSHLRRGQLHLHPQPLVQQLPSPKSHEQVPGLQEQLAPPPLANLRRQLGQGLLDPLLLQAQDLPPVLLDLLLDLVVLVHRYVLPLLSKLQSTPSHYSMKAKKNGRIWSSRLMELSRVPSGMRRVSSLSRWVRVLCSVITVLSAPLGIW